MSWQPEKGTNTNVVTTGDPFAIIYNENMWKLYKVSPLHSMRYSAVKLKMYASKTKQAIVSSVQASAANYTVTFEEVPKLKNTEDDASGLTITVESSTLEKATRPKLIYMAVLLSWGVSMSVESATHLPYMLEKGEQNVGTAVKSTLQQLFDCNICQFTFKQHQILKLGFNLVDCDTSRSTELFTLRYTTSKEDQKDKATLAFDIGDIRIIWNGSKNESVSHSEQVNIAYNILHNQLFDSTAFDISFLEICGVVLPKAEIKSNGVVKMKTRECVDCVFSVLNEISSPLQYDDD